MRLVAGKVIEGKVVVDAGSLEEGAAVTVLASDEADAFTFNRHEEAEMEEALKEADRGDFVDGDEFLRTLHVSR